MPERVPAAAPELSLSLLGKLLATIGLVLAFPAIWVDAVGSESYWHQSSGHAVGAAMLVLAVGSLALLAANLAQPRSVPERAYSIPGLVLGGLFLFVPFEFMSEHSELLKAGAWLGLAAALTLALGSIVTAVAGRPGGMELKAGRGGLGQALTGLGIVLIFPAIWTDFVESLTYWDTSLGHGVGIGMLVLAIAAGPVPGFTASFGVSHSDEWTDLEELLRAADNALFRAKREGRNRVIVEGLLTT